MPVNRMQPKDRAGLSEDARRFLQATLAQRDGDTERTAIYLARTLRIAGLATCRAMVIAASKVRMQ